MLLSRSIFGRLMYSEIHNYIKHCHECQVSKHSTKPIKCALKPLQIEPLFARFHMDILCNLPVTAEGYKHVLLVVESLFSISNYHSLKNSGGIGGCGGLGLHMSYLCLDVRLAWFLIGGQTFCLD